jgi:hypothetical protein
MTPFDLDPARLGQARDGLVELRRREAQPRHARVDLDVARARRARSARGVERPACAGVDDHGDETVLDEEPALALAEAGQHHDGDARCPPAPERDASST